jgi:hypothetical protein
LDYLVQPIPKPSLFGKRGKDTIGDEKSTGWLAFLGDVFGTRTLANIRRKRLRLPSDGFFESAKSTHSLSNARFRSNFQAIRHENVFI